MSYVSVWKPVNNRIIDAALGSKNEIIGLLLGRLEDDTIIIEDTITGEYAAEATRVVLPAQTLAKIADALVKGRVKGNVVGWYHSHTEGGLFFSATDVQTQKNLQQFSPLMLGMVVDADTGNVGYYRIETQTGQPTQIPDNKIKIYENPADAISRQAIRPYERTAIPPTPVVEGRRAPTPPALPASILKFRTRTIVLAVIVVVIAVSALAFGAWLYRSTSTASRLSIALAPIVNVTVGTPTDVVANVTGAQLVRLAYTVAGSSTPTVVNMTHTASNTYSFMIPGAQVTGVILYHVEATDSSGNTVQSGTYQIVAADFQLVTSNSSLIVYRSQSATSTVRILPVNGFSEPVTLNVTGRPAGILVGFSQNPVPAGVDSIIMNVIAAPQAENGTFTFNVTASVSPPKATPLLRQVAVHVTVADFNLASPSTIVVSRGSAATVLLNLTATPGFSDRISIGLQGLPSGVSATFSVSGSTIQIGPGTTLITLNIASTRSVSQGTYTLTITSSGGGITHRQIVQLTVR